LFDTDFFDGSGNFKYLATGLTFFCVPEECGVLGVEKILPVSELLVGDEHGGMELVDAER
jgi:hypothetical protein